MVKTKKQRSECKNCVKDVKEVFEGKIKIKYWYSRRSQNGMDHAAEFNICGEKHWVLVNKESLCLFYCGQHYFFENNLINKE